MIGWPGLLMIAVGFAVLIFFYMQRSAKGRQEKRSERFQRHKDYYDALMERRKKTKDDSVNEARNEDQ